MSQEDTITRVHHDALELAELLRPEWPRISAELHTKPVLVCEGDGGGDGGGSGEGGDGESGGSGAGAAAGGEGGDGDRQTFDRPYVEQLRRENAAARKRAQEAEQRAKEFEDRDKSEAERLAEKAEADAQRAQTAELQLLRYEVAADKGVPTKLAKFLTGSSKEDLEQAADELLAELGQGASRTSFDGGARETAAGGAAINANDMDAAIRRAAGRP